MISYKVFMSFVGANNDTSRIQSKECYNTWVLTRKTPPKQPEESFRRVLTAHVCGVDGRRPFPPEVEADLLSRLRKKEVWECFRGTNVSIGIRGFRNHGYHEMKRLQKSGGPGAIAAGLSRGALEDNARKRGLVRSFDQSKKIKSSLVRENEKVLELQTLQIQQKLQEMEMLNRQLMTARNTLMQQQLLHDPQYAAVSSQQASAPHAAVATGVPVQSVQPVALRQTPPQAVSQESNQIKQEQPHIAAQPMYQLHTIPMQHYQNGNMVSVMVPVQGAHAYAQPYGYRQMAPVKQMQAVPEMAQQAQPSREGTRVAIGEREPMATTVTIKHK